MTSQEQKGGIGSSNFQVGTLSVGMSYKDVRDIALDVYHDNAAVLKKEAVALAEERVAQLADELAEKLSLVEPRDLAGFAHPEKQVAILDAQKAYALSGDEELRHLLVDSIIRLSSEPERSLRSVVLGEAIKVMPVLQKNQIYMLVICFMMRSVAIPNVTPDGLSNALQAALGPDFSTMEIRDADFSHINFSRAAQEEVLELGLGSLISIHTGGQRDIDEPAKQKLISDFAVNPAGIFVASAWDTTKLKNLRLTSVGTAISHTFVKRNISMADLSIWI